MNKQTNNVNIPEPNKMNTFRVNRNINFQKSSLTVYTYATISLFRVLSVVEAARFISEPITTETDTWYFI